MKFLLRAAIFILVGFAAGGCGKEEPTVEKVSDIEFAIVESEDIPEELMLTIDEKKEQVFKITYYNDEDFFIAVGYGKQKSGGYSIRINDCYQSKNAIIFDTELLGPMQDEVVEKGATYPFIVVRMKYLNLPVVFE